MASISDILSSASRLSNDEMRGVCEQIIEEVGSRISKNKIGMWTFQSISRWVDRDPTDALLLSCIRLLTSEEGPRLLEMHFLFFDPCNADDLGQPIEDDFISEAYRTGELINPYSGEVVSDFEQALVPYFVPSADLIPLGEATSNSHLGSKFG